MNKILSFITVAMLAALTQASVISWESGTIYIINSDGSLSSKKNGVGTVQGFVFFLDKETYDSLDVAEIVSTYFDMTATVPTLKEGKTASATGSSNKNGVVKIAQTVPATTGIKYYSAFVYFQKDENDVYWVTANKGYDSINDQALQNNEASLNVGTSGGYGATGWAKYTTIPEPTTVALLAFGLAAVGLKRKRA